MNELLEILTSMEHVIKRRWSRREIHRCARRGRAGSLKVGSLRHDVYCSPLHGMTIHEWNAHHTCPHGTRREVQRR